MCNLQEMQLKQKTDRFKTEGWKKMHHFNSNKGIKAGIVDFGAKNIIGYKERGVFHKNKGVTSLR